MAKKPVGGRRGSPCERLRTARGRRLGSTRWLQRQLNDPYVHAARRAGYRSRAAFKLIEIDDRFAVLKPGQRVIDLGAAPGSWCQVAAARVRGGTIVGLDLQEVEAVGGVTLLVGDILDPATPRRLREALAGPADVVLSDLAAAATGHAATDHLRTIALAEAAAALVEDVLAPGGALVVKVLQGVDEPALFGRLRQRFGSVRRFKPPASRGESTELYLVAVDYRGRPVA